MRRFSFALFVIATALPCVGFAATLEVKPTTTLAAETSNNTSAANSFATQVNGNLGASNVSKVDVHSLLYPGARTQVFAHLMLWFGATNHKSVGYNSTDPQQVKRQIQDMISRGIDGVIIDWYGSNNAVDQATQLVMTEAEAHPGFTFAIMVDQGAIKRNLCSGCTPQQVLVQQLLYIEQRYFPSPAYLRLNGSPVVTNFDIDLVYKVDWLAAKAALATAPSFLFQNSGGFSHVHSDGSYSWVMPTTSDYGASYLTNFYNTGLALAPKETVGATYKGFNDKLAGWGANRVMGQQCGQTWLQTFSKANSLHNSTKQLDLLQLVTWNDYEEGTEIESGIDNCVNVSATVSGGSLQWNIAGLESTIDHYRVYVSTDSQNLMPLTDLAAGLHSLNVCSYPLASGNYTLYLQAVGKPSFKNQMSGPVGYTSKCSGTPPAQATAKIVLGASPASAVIQSGQSVNSTITVTSEAGSLNDPVSFSCSNLPKRMACSFLPSTVIPSSGTASTLLTVSTSAVSSALGHPRSEQRKIPLTPYWFAFGVAGLALFGRVRQKRINRSLVASGLIGMAVLLSSCGGSQDRGPSISAVGVSAGTYAITITGVSGSSQASTVATITIR